MPRTSSKHHTIAQIEEAIEHAIIASVAEPSLLGNANYHLFVESLFAEHSSLTSIRYINPQSHDSAGRLPIDSLTQFLDYPDNEFRANFRTAPDSFSSLVRLLEERGGVSHWRENYDKGNRPPREQIAVALYVLGTPGASSNRVRMKLNIDKDTAYLYLWRTINLLAALKGEFIQWPTPETRSQLQRSREDDVFRNCVGYIDGTEIPLSYSPMKDREAYFSRKKIYGFSLQAVCNVRKQFTYVHMGPTARTHDSTAYKASSLYQNRSSMLFLGSKWFC